MKNPFCRCENHNLVLVVETFFIIISVNMEANQIRTCVNVHVFVWSGVQCCTCHLHCCQNFSFKNLSASRYLSCLGMNFNM